MDTADITEDVFEDCYNENFYWLLNDAYMSYKYHETHDNFVEITPRSKAMNGLADAAEVTSMYLSKIINEGEDLPDSASALVLFKQRSRIFLKTDSSKIRCCISFV